MSTPVHGNIGSAARSILDIIGKTPVVFLKTIGKVDLLIKLEGLNPSGSIKDVPVHYMILDAEKKGLLKKGSTIIEATSGNTGIALSMISAIKGYKAKIVMPSNASEERIKIMKAYGAEVILTPSNQGIDGAIRKVKELIKKNPELVYLDQYNNQANWLGHYYLTANEVWRQTNGQVTHVVAGMGTGGTLMGLSKRLHELDPEVRIIGVEPIKGHHIQGLKNMSESRVPGIYKEEWLDDKRMINDEEAFSAARRLAKKYGILGGMSTGAALAVGEKIARKLEYGVVVVISPDGGFKYLSTKLFND